MENDQEVESTGQMNEPTIESHTDYEWQRFVMWTLRIMQQRKQNPDRMVNLYVDTPGIPEGALEVAKAYPECYKRWATILRVKGSAPIVYPASARHNTTS